MTEAAESHFIIRVLHGVQHDCSLRQSVTEAVNNTSSYFLQYLCQMDIARSAVSIVVAIFALLGGGWVGGGEAAVG